MTFASVYEILTPLSTIRKTKFWDWFDGDALRSWWSETGFGAGGTVSMADGIDEGLKLVSNTANQDGVQIDHTGSVRHYSHTASVEIAIFRFLLTTTFASALGFRDTPTGGTDFVFAGADTFFDASNFILRSSDASSNSTLSTTLALDTTFHIHKLEMGSANIKQTIDGVLENTKTTNRPTVKLHPAFYSQTRTTAARESHIRYIEVFNL